MSARGSIFDSDDELDVSGFAPKAAPPPKAPLEEVRAIAEASNFRSREAKPAAPAIAPEPAKRQPRRHKTGRTAQLNTRTTPATVEAYYAIADRQGWLMGETIERALAALQRELASEG